MTIERVKDPGWGVNEKLTSGQANDLDIQGTYALDKRAGQFDALLSQVTVGADGGVTFGVDSFLVTNAGAVVTFGSDITANGAAVFNGAVTINDPFSCTDAAAFHGTTRCYSTLRVDGTTLLEDTLTLVGTNVYFASLISDVEIGPVINIANGATGVAFTLSGQTCTGTVSHGGDVIVDAGGGTSTDGSVRLRVAGVNVGSFSGSSILFSQRLSVAGEIHSIPAAPAYAANVELDFSASSVQFPAILTGDVIFTYVGAQTGGIYVVEVVQDGTGGRAVTWSGNFFFGGLASSADATANKKTIWLFVSHGSAALRCIARNTL